MLSFLNSIIKNLKIEFIYFSNKFVLKMWKIICYLLFKFNKHNSIILYSLIKKEKNKICNSKFNKISLFYLGNFYIRMKILKVYLRGKILIK